MKRNTYKTKLDITDVISGRLNLQTVQKTMVTNFGVKKPTLSYLSTADFLTQYHTWEPETKDSFLNLLGGPVNYERTKWFIGKLSKNTPYILK